MMDSGDLAQLIVDLDPKYRKKLRGRLIKWLESPGRGESCPVPDHHCLSLCYTIFDSVEDCPCKRLDQEIVDDTVAEILDLLEEAVRHET